MCHPSACFHLASLGRLPLDSLYWRSPINKNVSSLLSVIETTQEYILVKVRLVLKFLLSRRKQKQHWKQAIREISAHLKTLEIWRTLPLIVPEETQRALPFSRLTWLHWFQTMISSFGPSCIVCAATWEKTNEYTSPQNSRKQLAPECRGVFSGLLFKQQLQLKFLRNNIYILGLNSLQSCLAYGGYKHGKNKCVWECVLWAQCKVLPLNAAQYQLLKFKILLSMLMVTSPELVSNSLQNKIHWCGPKMCRVEALSPCVFSGREWGIGQSMWAWKGGESKLLFIEPWGGTIHWSSHPHISVWKVPAHAPQDRPERHQRKPYTSKH